jgi:Protein of unknown function (DUF3574)
MTHLSRRLLIALALCAPAGTLLAQRGPHHDISSEARLCTTVLHGQRLQRTELFFGRNSPSGEISEQDFQGFLDAVVTPLFPDGLTVIDGKGQFRASANSAIEKEAAKVLVLLYRFDKQESDKIEEIRSRYKSRFAQQSVLRVDEPVCASF